MLEQRLDLTKKEFNAEAAERFGKVSEEWGNEHESEYQDEDQSLMSLVVRKGIRKKTIIIPMDHGQLVIGYTRY